MPSLPLNVICWGGKAAFAADGRRAAAAARAAGSNRFMIVSLRQPHRGIQSLQFLYLLHSEGPIRRPHVSPGNSEEFEGGAPEWMTPDTEKGHVAVQDHL